MVTLFKVISFKHLIRIAIAVFALLIPLTALLTALVVNRGHSVYSHSGIVNSHSGIVEIFDIDNEQVVKKVQSTPAIQSEVKNFLNGITSIYAKFNPIPQKGFMVKIPLEPTVQVSNEWLDTCVDEVIIIFPEHAFPYLMVFEDGIRPLVFTFAGNTDALLKHLDYFQKQCNQSQDQFLTDSIPQTDPIPQTEWSKLNYQEREYFLERIIMISYAPQIKEAVDNFYEEPKGFDLVQISDVKAVGPYTYEMKIEISTYAGAHNPPYGLDTLTVRFNSLCDGKVVDFEHKEAS